MRTIPLTLGYVALVDDEDYERLSAYSWHAHICREPSGYKKVYARRITSEGGNQIRVYMHRDVLSCELGIDHRDTNGLNNQRSNLRPATQSQNNANFRKRGGCASAHKGVSWFKERRKWQAKITVNYKQIHIGLFRDECDAALAYNLKALEAFGEFARFNTPLKEIII